MSRRSPSARRRPKASAGGRSSCGCGACGCGCEEQMPIMKGRRGIVPPGAVYIGRQIRFLRLLRSKWANPFKIGRDGTRAEVISKYRDHLLSAPELMAALPELRGKDLACWCAPEPCHGEVFARASEFVKCPRRRTRHG